MLSLVKKPWESLKSELKDKWQQLIGNEGNEKPDAKRPTGGANQAHKKTRKKKSRTSR